MKRIFLLFAILFYSTCFSITLKDSCQHETTGTEYSEIEILTDSLFVVVSRNLEGKYRIFSANDTLDLTLQASPTSSSHYNLSVSSDVVNDTIFIMSYLYTAYANSTIKTFKVLPNYSNAELDYIDTGIYRATDSRLCLYNSNNFFYISFNGSDNNTYWRTYSLDADFNISLEKSGKLSDLGLSGWRHPESLIKLDNTHILLTEHNYVDDKGNYHIFSINSSDSVSVVYSGIFRSGGQYSSATKITDGYFALNYWDNDDYKYYISTWNYDELYAISWIDEEQYDTYQYGTYQTAVGKLSDSLIVLAYSSSSGGMLKTYNLNDSYELSADNSLLYDSSSTRAKNITVLSENYFLLEAINSSERGILYGFYTPPSDSTGWSHSIMGITPESVMSINSTEIQSIMGIEQ